MLEWCESKMMSSELVRRVALLEKWLSSWKNSKGGYGGLVATFWESSFICYPHVSHQSGMINGYITLYQKTHDKEWLNKAKDAANFLIQNKVSRNDKTEFLYAFGDTPSKGTGLIHQVTPCIALFRLSKILKDSNDLTWKLYFQNAKQVIDEYVIKKLWNGSFLDCSFKHNNYVHNQSMKACEALMFLNGKKYEKIMKSCGDLITAHQIRKPEMLYGAIPQARRDSRVISVYNGKCIGGLISLYERFQDEKYLEVAIDLARFLKKNEQNGAIYSHYEPRRIIGFSSFTRAHAFTWKLKKYPLWIARISETIRNILELKRFGFSINVSPNIHYILKHQRENGSFQNTIGFKGDPNRLFWEDVAGIVRWNVCTFELLTYLLPMGVTVPKVETLPVIKIPYDSGIYIESEDDCFLEEGKKRKYIKKRKKDEHDAWKHIG